jgi:Flp pilus assembly protein TadG
LVNAFKTALHAKHFFQFIRHANFGGTAITFAAMVPVLMSTLGLATDWAVFNLKRTALQSAADAAAIAGANELRIANAGESEIKSVARSYVDHTLAEDSHDVETAVSIDRDEATVRVALKETWTPLFAYFLGARVTPILVDASATLAGSTSICVLALDPTGPSAIHMDRYAQLKAQDCGVYSNSSHSEGIRLDLESRLRAELVCSAGGIKAKTTAISPSPITDCPRVPDPLVDRPAPPLGTCDYSDLVVNTGTKTLSPGTYCGGITIGGTAKVIFQPGIYIVQDGKFKASGAAVISGEHVGFFLAGAKSVLDFSNDATVILTGPKTGDMAGLLFFEDRTVPLNRRHRINSTNARVLTGTIYLSRGNLQVDPNASVAQDSAYTAIVSNRVELDQGPELIMNSDYDATDVPVPAGVRSIRQVVLTE